MNAKRVIGHFFLGYLSVTVLCYALGFAVHALMRLPPAADPIMDPAFQATLPVQLLINFAVWTLAAWLLRRRSGGGFPGFKGSLLLGACWLAMALAVDLVFFVLIPSPVALTPRQFYVEYQPWISLVYLSVFCGPVLVHVAALLRKP